MKWSRSSVVFLTLFASFLTACSGEVTEEELRLWKNTENGQRKIQEVIKDVKQPESIRLKAIEVLVENELSYKALDAIKESPDSLKLINGIKGWLFSLLNKDENMQKIARDMCILFLDFVKDKDKNLHKEIGEEIGKWLLDGVNATLEISEENSRKLAQAFFTRITMTQLLSLKRYAVPSLLKLISRGVEVDNLAAVIVDLKSPDLTQKLFETLKSLEKEKNYTPDDKFMRALYKIYTEEAGVYIVDLILNKKLTLEDNKDDLAYAFETALKMSTELNSAAIRDKLFRLLEMKEYLIRYQTGVELIKIGKEKGEGAKYLDKVLSAFQDDGIYPKKPEEIQNDFPSFCIEAVAPLGKTATPVLIQHLDSKSRVEVALSILCLKVIGDESAIEALGRFKKSKVMMEDLFGPLFSLQIIAQNAVEAIPYMDRLNNLFETKQLDYRIFYNVRAIINRDMASFGKEWIDQLEKFLRIALEKQKEFEEKKKKEDQKKNAETQPEIENPASEKTK